MATTMKLTVEHDGQTYEGSLATITGTRFGFEHFGGISATLETDTTCDVGGYALDRARRDDSGRITGRAGTAFGLDHLIRLLEVAGAERWEDLPGRQIVVLFEEGAAAGFPAGIAGASNGKVLIFSAHAEASFAGE